MALKLVVDTPYGYEAEYWKLVQTNFNWFEHKAHIVIQCWKNEEFRRVGGSPVPGLDVSYDVNGELFIALLGEDYMQVGGDANLVSRIYGMIKTDPRFESAIDC